MTKRKKPEGSDNGDDQSVPIPIQIFLWRQTSPFIRPKLGKLCEASCVSFERVIVQNILHGLSPSLCEAIESVSRWRLVRAAFPHVLHCCASMLSTRDSCAREAAISSRRHAAADHSPDTSTPPVSRPKFTSNEVKLLYALHWIVLDSASECEDADNEAGQLTGITHAARSYLLSLDDIHLFVFLLAPLVGTVAESDFQTLKLENGLRLWEPLWSFTQPDVPCFTTPVKQRRVVLRAQRPSQTRVNFNMANIYVGNAGDDIYCGDEPSPPPETVDQHEGDDDDDDDYEERSESVRESSASESLCAPLARMSDICALSTTETTVSVDPTTNCGSETCQQGQSAGVVDSGCSMAGPSSCAPPPPPLRRSSSVSSDGRSLGLPGIDGGRLETAINAFARAYPNSDVVSASCFDVAVLRCLFCAQWPEGGVYWGLRYVHRRLLEIVSETQNNTNFQLRQRSNSLPVPNFQMFVTPPGMQDRGETALPLVEPDGRQPSFKRTRPIDYVVLGLSTVPPERRHSIEAETSRPDSALSRLTENEEDSTVEDDEDDVEDSSSDAAKRSLRGRTDSGEARVTKHLRKRDTDDDSSGSGGKAAPVSELQKPIITITTDSQAPSPASRSPLSWSERVRRSSQLSTNSKHFLETSVDQEPTVGEQKMPRSLTDSKINYAGDGGSGEDSVEELPGSMFYVGADGQMDYRVVLMAVHAVSGRAYTTRVCAVLLNVVNCLVDLGAVTSAGVGKTDASSDDHADVRNTAKDGGDYEKLIPGVYHEDSTLCMAVETIFRVYKSLGCPNGCSDGVRGGQADDLRAQALSCLQRLTNLDATQFQFYIERTLLGQPLQSVMDQLHALLGFCKDPAVTANQPGVHSGPRKSVHEPASSRTGYGHNFGEIPGGGPGVLGQIIVQILKPLLNKCVNSRKELYAHENIGLYCDVRQLLTYVKETHGSTFRRVALGGLLDALKYPTFVPREPVAAPPPKPMRRTQSVTSDSGDERDLRASSLLNGPGSKGRTSIFRRKIRKHLRHGHGLSLISHAAATSDTEANEDALSFHGRLSPRVSLSIANEDEMTPTTKHKSSKFNLAWRRSTKSDYDDDSASESGPTPLGNRGVSGGSQDHLSRVQQHHSGGGISIGSAASLVQRQKNISFKATSQATLGILSARRRLEDGLRCFSKRRQSKRESLCGDVDSFYRGSLHDANALPGQANNAKDPLLQERKLVNAYVVKSGMLRFNFMMDCCNPGTLPDAHLVAALLDLEAPVVARAAMLLECSHLVSRCNRGDWPHWMKLNLPGFCQTGLPQPLTHARNQPNGHKRSLVLQRTTGRLFYQWAEALGNHLLDILAEESANAFSIVEPVKDETKKKELKTTDEEEDFMDEATVNRTGSACPYALKMIACHLLLEITSFLRETYQHLPRHKVSHRSGCAVDPVPWIDRQTSSSRRWSSVLGSPGNSERSNSRSSQGECLLPGSGAVDRKISFAVFGASERSDSLHSSTTSISQPDASGDGKGRSSTSIQSQKLLKARRGSGGHNTSFKQNRSFRVKRHEEAGSGVGRMGSVKSRKVSTQSLQSNASTDEMPTSSSYAIFEESSTAEASGAVPSAAEEFQETQTDYAADGSEDTDFSRNMPWIKVVVQLANSSNFICDHATHCHPNCYERQRRSCKRLIAAILQVYSSEPPEPTLIVEVPISRSDSGKDLIKDKLKRRESVFQTSPTSRRDSAPLVDKVKVDISLAAKAKLAIAAEKEEERKRSSKKIQEELPMVKYLNTQILTLGHTLLALITKAAAIVTDEQFVDVMPVAWELLIESDQELAAASAVVFILASVRAPESVKELMTHQLRHTDVAHRTSAILRFAVLWRFRYQVWPRMEEGAHIHFKVPPPSIDFVLPSPTIGLPVLPIVDPPWMPHFKTKVEEVTINQTESKSFVTATTTRRKQQQQMVHRALLAEEDRRRAARENFRMLTVPVCQQASCEPALLHSTGEDHDEAVIPDEVALSVASRRMSVAPVNRAAASNIRNMSGRHGSMFYGRSTFVEGDDDKAEHFHSHHMQTAQQFFPSCICNAVLHIIHLLEDLEVNADGVAVCAVAEKVIWDCLVEEPTLFLRTFLEKLTHRNRQEELTFLMRKLLYNIQALPAQTAHSLFNYIIGYIMFYVRSPAEGGQEAVAKAMSILWLVVPSVSGIYFKDLKQTLRKEQCDPTLMVTANVPSAKKLIVHGPDLSCIPSQFPIQEDTQFLHILHESLDFFNIPANEQSFYFLVDTKTNQMHNINGYVRDFYFFRRNFYPQLSLVRMNPDEASATLQYQALIQKFVEMGKVLFSLSVVENSQGQQIQSHVSFLHEELLKLPSFPRKALESEFGMHRGDMGEEIAGVDLLHKLAWTKLIATMFRGMSSTVTHAGDLPLFLNVVNGTLLLHADDTAMLRLCMATFINACRHFKQVFATTGFTFIMPTILKVYSNSQSNPVVCDVIHFACRQFFLLHRNPFVLQMFGSVSPILNISDDDTDREPNFNKVDPDAFFRLLLSFGTNLSDSLNILEMVDGDKPLTPLDFCYKDDSDDFAIIDAVNLCVTVVAYACDSVRALQMLVILKAILPPYLQHLKEQTTKQFSLMQARDEMSVIHSLSASVRALILSCEPMARNFSGQQRQFESANTGPNRAQQQNHGNHSNQKTCKIYADEQSDIRFLNMEEGLTDWNRGSMEDESEVALSNYRRPRNFLLCIVSNFFHHCTGRGRELRRLLSESSSRATDLLDHKSHSCLADIAHTLLKIAPYDPVTLKSAGLRRYMLEVLPITDWSQTAVRPALNLILRRLERMFCKIFKKSTLRHHLDWNAATNLVTAVHQTLANCVYVAHLPHLKAVISTCLNIVLSDDSSNAVDSGSDHSVAYKVVDGVGTGSKMFVPAKFCSAVIKLTALQMYSLGDLYSLEQVCGGLSVFPTTEKTINVLVNLILPLCIRMGSGNSRKDNTSMQLVDINFALTVVLHALVPPIKQQTMPSSTGSTKQRHLSVSDNSTGRTASVMSRHGRSKTVAPHETLQTVAFLGLRLLMVCFEKQLASQWHRISKSIMELSAKLQGGAPLWTFLDFVVTVRMPLFVMLRPFIMFKMMKVSCETEQEYYFQQTVYQKLHGCNMPAKKCKGSLLVDLAAELRQIKDDLTSDQRPGSVSSPAYSNVSRRSRAGSSTGGIPRTSSIHDLLEHQVAIRMQSVPVAQSSAKSSHIPVARTMSCEPHLIRIQPSTPSPDRVSQHSIATGLSRAPTHEPLADNTAFVRTTSKRISAKDGSLILSRYVQKTASQDDDVEVGDLSPQSSKTDEGLVRSRMVIYRGIIRSKQSLTKSLQEDGVGSNEGLTRRRSALIRSHRTVQSDEESWMQSACGRGRICSSGVFVETGAAAGAVGRTRLTSGDGVPESSENADDSHVHRLQRQDAKSRKTFKIKRNYGTVKDSTVSRSATVKGEAYGMRPRLSHGDNAKDDNIEQSLIAGEDEIFDVERQDSTCETGEVIDDVRPTEDGGSLWSEGRAVDVPSSLTTDGNGRAGYHVAKDGRRQLSPAKSAARFLQKSKSHDSDSLPSIESSTTTSHVLSGTARARIARHGARNAQARSPSSSPVRHGGLHDRSSELEALRRRGEPSSSDSEDDGQKSGETRQLVDGDSTTTTEIGGQTSIVLYFDDTELKDTRV